MVNFEPLNSLAIARPSDPITLDSRKASPGVIFVAAKGASLSSLDGHSFILQALQNGCSGLIVERVDFEIPFHIPVWRTNHARIAAAILSEEAFLCPSRQLDLCGVTGTNGKTSVTFLLAAMAEAFGKKSGVLGTLGAGSTRNLTYFGLTTPEAENLSAYLGQFRNQGFDQIAMEVSSHALATHRVDGLSFKAAAFTNLSQDHLDFHQTFDHYLTAKARLFHELLPNNAYAILPSTDPNLNQLKPRNARTLLWGTDSKADIAASQIRFTPQGLSFTLRVLSESIEVQAPLFGRFNLENILCAAGLAYASGISLEATAQGLQNPILPKGRLERVSPSLPAVFVDFAHSPDALEKALQTLREISQGRIKLVFGCGGDRDRIKRPLMTQVAHQNADDVFITLDNPRHEAPNQIIADMQPLSTMTVLLNRQEAIRAAIQSCAQEDMVLIAGKGHETTQQIGDEFRPFDDARIAREILFDRHPNS
ncbi:MAG: UDP-N-acetylmuramoyl-L-alanyl-D-glutamate--2,6-diaminopimelate ligase [Myxococcaceae bacterium]|nr:UDP-N-acetylmuramoyl-L-alanyl-D-glutamate--2,6-diaminopimelate ligase [Myxococcaceae bacterium]MBH2006043.1 UDP-N-acetylmuramoyl-L-alanyl-D-glutamate--2,6-diaminopimelate ligase [Myxococcaceae bacterium]